MKIAIVDDERYWRERTQKVIERYFGINVPVIDIYLNGESFLQADIYYDLVVLDIEMNRIDGFMTAKEYKEKYPDVSVILLTTHTELVTKGYEVNAFRYIYKDQMEEKIPEALKAYQLILEKEKTIAVNEIGLGEVFIRIKSIIYVTKDKRNTLIHTKTKDYVCSAGLQELEDQLAPYGFFRTYKSFLVNVYEVESFDKRDIVMKDQSVAYMSSRKYANFRAFYLEEKIKMGNG